MSDSNRSNVNLLIAAGIGLGVLAGVSAALLLADRKRDIGSSLSETVDDLRDKAERVLQELSDSVTELKDQAQRVAAEIATAAENA